VKKNQRDLLLRGTVREIQSLEIGYRNPLTQEGAEMSAEGIRKRNLLGRAHHETKDSVNNLIKNKVIMAKESDKKGCSEAVTWSSPRDPKLGDERNLGKEPRPRRRA